MAENKAERIMDALEPISAEPVEYLFEIISKQAETVLTPELKKRLQTPRGKHRRTSWEEEALAEWLEAVESGEL